MNEKEIVNKIMEEQNKSLADVATIVGLSQAALWDRLRSPKNKSLTVAKLNEILTALNYEVVLMPRAKAGKIDGAYVVSREEGDK